MGVYCCGLWVVCFFGVVIGVVVFVVFNCFSYVKLFI